jgi:hypothetical protein
MGLLPKSTMMISHRTPLSVSLEREEELESTIVSILLEAGHRGAGACHIVIASELTANGTTEGGILREEKNVVYPLYIFRLVCELDVGE